MGGGGGGGAPKRGGGGAAPQNGGVEVFLKWAGPNPSTNYDARNLKLGT